MDEAVSSISGFETKILHSILRQSKCYRLKQEHYVPFKDKEHRCDISLDQEGYWRATIPSKKDPHK